MPGNRKKGGGGGSGGGSNKQACHDFQRSGACPRGDKCKFSHGAQSSSGGHRPMSDDDQRGPWLPPGADRQRQVLFGRNFDPSFVVPRRLSSKSADMVNAVNDFHYAMVNDHQRNEFYRNALKAVITPQSRVLEIGTGSGLLAMMAVQLGCEWVVAVEANRDMANLAWENIRANKLEERIRVVNKLSTDMQPSDMPAPANVLVSEVFGTLLLGESALDYIHDARMRLLEPNAAIVPPHGTQYATLIECPDLEAITSVSEWGGLDLRHLNTLQDTASVVFTKQYGFRFSTVPLTRVTERLPVLEINFGADDPARMPSLRRFTVPAKHTGTAHAVLLTWEAYSDDAHTDIMTTEPGQTSFARDLQWGQALQLIDDADAGDGTTPTPFRTTAGEMVEVTVRYSSDGVVMQFEVRRK
eukprot:NODE_1411_length_1542_cov_33.421969_g1272_i0.p1 GENE.NODE_1411_length_1542_cov_33.421969_g1272_i0~~NODE_1411_length_1542_cov_33.421969_g1272_i0.p1  ORF type:complete len:413 (-),score=51.63 NODE_1411_length_1542_cov_33.421969_g1272_i0:230-1468(-)